jgi:hypothetical protein
MKNNHMKPTLEPSPDWIVKQTGFHSIPAGAGFDDDGGIVPVTLPDSSGDPTADLIKRLAETGATFPNAQAARDEIENSFDSAADNRAAQALKMIFDNLPGGQRGQELRAAMLGFSEKDGQKLADEFGTSKQNFHQRIKRIRTSILKKKAFTASP